ncbi:carbohydrate kinase family protein [Brevibacillus sp. B_LB10_24]|uniref:carbohydrate kinase family protein n=1 Tax=Brevibacillus sp. B_LB10_24 TaxID=3380645 RepID=UPI0038BC48D1
MKTKVLILGGILVDHYMLVEKFPERGQDVQIKDSFYKVGGCAINVAKTLQNVGMDPFIVATIGSDYRGQMISQYLNEQGFDRRCIHTDKERESGYSVSLVEASGERTFLTYKGCDDRFSPEMVSPDLLPDIGYVYLTGYYLLEPNYHRDILQLLARIREFGGKIMFDPGPLAAEIDQRTLLDVIQLAHVVTPNETESEKIARIYRVEGKVSDWFLAQGVEVVVLKKGSEGVTAWTADGQFGCSPFSVKSIDTTGAGDSFAGGFIFGLINQYSLEFTLKFASACGAISTTFLGPHGNFTLADVNRLIDGERS